MIKSVSIICIALALFSCGYVKSDLPPIPEDQFIQVLADVRLLESYYAMKYQVIDTSRGRMEGYYQEIFSRYNITKEDFEKSYIAYEADPKRMMGIEDKVMERLTTRQMKDSTAIYHYQP